MPGRWLGEGGAGLGELESYETEPNYGLLTIVK